MALLKYMRWLKEKISDDQESNLKTPEKERKGKKRESAECDDSDDDCKLPRIELSRSPLKEERKGEKGQCTECDDSDDDCKLPRIELSRSTPKKERKGEKGQSTECDSSKTVRKRKKLAAKPVEEDEVHISDDSELPDIPSDITDPKSDSNFKTSTPKKRLSSAATNDEEVQNLKTSTPKKRLSSETTNDEEMLEPTTSTFDQEQSHLSPENEIIDQEIEKFFDLMEMKIKRKKMAEDTVISFPDKEERKLITIVYQDHGGMSLTRPFCKDDTLQSIFMYICKEVEAEILPTVFHLECMAPLKCEIENCKHCFELETSHSVTISSLPDVLIIKEGNFLMDDTITNYGNVLM